MGYSSRYVILDEVAVRPLWAARWPELFRAHRGLRKEAIGDEPGSGFADIGVADEELERLPEILARERVRDTIRRSGVEHIWVIDWVLESIPALRPHYVGADAGCTDHHIILGLTAQGFLREEMPASALRSAFRLHGYTLPPSELEFSAREARRIRTAVGDPGAWKGWYRWQPAWFLDDMYESGCLGVADTRRFIRLLDVLWAQNPQVLDNGCWVAQAWQDERYRSFGRYRPGGQQEDGPMPRFREFWLSRQLRRAVRRAAAFERPVAYWFWN